MLRGHKKINLDEIDKIEPIDSEIRELIDLINNVEGIETTESCSGHGKYPVLIFGVADSIADLNKFMYDYFYSNKCWKFVLYIDDIMIDDNDWDKVKFYIESLAPVGSTNCNPEVCVSCNAINHLTETFRKYQDAPRYNQQLKVIKEIK